MCATGNLALREDDFVEISNGAYIASVTSSDDELELGALDGLYERTPAEEHITRYARTGHYFYVLADGNAVNFLELEEETGISWHGAVAQVGHDVIPVDIDLHTIPASPAKGEPEH